MLALGYAVVGWGIGMRFTPDVLRHAARAAPRVLGSILALIAICGGFGAALVVAGGRRSADRLSRHQPRRRRFGLDHRRLDQGRHAFVLAMQVARFVLVIVVGPAQARLLSRSAQAGGAV